MDEVHGSILLPWGWLTVTVGAAGVRRLDVGRGTPTPLPGMWAEALQAYAQGAALDPALPVDLSGVQPFTQRVLTACRAIPFGHTTTYGALAAQLGIPHGARAVGQALARNPALLFIPCHRVLGSGGRLTGFRGGLALKHQLLAHEGIGTA
jgi:O-6-methylguanine DNA methyltransferase